MSLGLFYYQYSLIKDDFLQLLLCTLWKTAARERVVKYRSHMKNIDTKICVNVYTFYFFQLTEDAAQRVHDLRASVEAGIQIINNALGKCDQKQASFHSFQCVIIRINF